MRVDGRENDPKEVEDAMHCLMKAEAIKQNPALMKACCDMAEKHKTAITSIADLKGKYNDLVNPHKKMPTKAGIEKETPQEESASDEEIEKRVKNNEM